MDLAVFFFAFTMFWKLTSSIRCYKCDAERSMHINIPLCEHFDGSEQFIADCPYSTVCVKKETSLRNLEDTTRSVERGCALQTRDDEQIKIDGKWHHVKPIHEIYTETCEEESNEFGTPTRTTHCYCKGDLCNTATRINVYMGIFLIVTIWLIVL